MEDAERAMIEFLVGHAATQQAKQVAMFLIEDAVHLAVPGQAKGVPCEGCPPIERLFEQYAESGGELLVCPISVTSRGLDDTEFVANAGVAGATPLWEWVGDEAATVFSY